MNETFNGGVEGGVRSVLRLEGLAVLALASGAYFSMGGVWWLYLVLFFAPDVSFAGYAGGTKMGAMLYNLAHSYATPAAIGALGWVTGSVLLQQLALIHAAHIGFDRSFGYGLKYARGFSDTHLGRIGRKRHPALG